MHHQQEPRDQPGAQFRTGAPFTERTILSLPFIFLHLKNSLFLSMDNFSLVCFRAPVSFPIISNNTL